MGVVYFYGGIAKLDPDWLGGLATKELMSIANRGTVLEDLIEYNLGSLFYGWLGMLFDLLIPFLMLWKPVRKWAFLAAVLFHINNYFVFPIGIFPVLSLVMTLMFFDADFPKKSLIEDSVNGLVFIILNVFQNLKKSVSMEKFWIIEQYFKNFSLVYWTLLCNSSCFTIPSLALSWSNKLA